MASIQIIRVAYFDLGDTVVQMQPKLQEDAVRRIAAEMGQPLKHQRQIAQAISRLKLACDAEWASRKSEILGVKNEADEREYWPGYYRAVLRRYGLEKPSPALVSLLAARAADANSFVCFNDVLPTLSALRDHKRLELGIISNSFPSAARILRELDLEKWFKYVVFSHEMECVKPAPQIYQRAVGIAHIQPEEALFVDDRPHFVKGAAAIQIRAVLLDRQGQYRKADWKGDRIRQLDKLIKIVDRVPGRRLNWARRLKSRFTPQTQTPSAATNISQAFAHAFVDSHLSTRDACAWSAEKSSPQLALNRISH